MPEAARVRSAKPPAGAAPAPPSGLPSGRRPSASEILGLPVTETVTHVNENVTPLPPFLLRVILRCERSEPRRMRVPARRPSRAAYAAASG